jgi:hypothetical protein
VREPDTDAHHPVAHPDHAVAHPDHAVADSDDPVAEQSVADPDHAVADSDDPVAEQSVADPDHAVAYSDDSLADHEQPVADPLPLEHLPLIHSITAAQTSRRQRENRAGGIPAGPVTLGRSRTTGRTPGSCRLSAARATPASCSAVPARPVFTNRLAREARAAQQPTCPKPVVTPQASWMPARSLYSGVWFADAG